ncbi:hypothetical protein OU994_18000 [Pseudoduganella sp. SL102]|uniref:hypothetical protein n=1 Tax=Pseudoduganella sp. SL102 TaxID=2995154 RepID=UPI00248B0689|nr:hypothetical protein [Pseudoduganella sp. SL102]WBS00214.1 hypothetical protein OU994_18000 [Pseudoduganella sp. SL102]
MNPWLLLGAGALWVASAACTFWYGTTVGRDGEVARQAKLEKAITETRNLAMKGAADAIAKIVVRNTTVQGRVETIVRDNPVYRDCVHSPDQLRNINEAITGRAGSAGGGRLPGADAAE